MKIIAHTLILVIGLILCLPVILLPFTTSVPFWVWIPLALGCIALIIVQFSTKSLGQRAVISLVGLVITTAVAVLSSQYFASTPPITDDNGNPLPGSIATLEKVELNGSDQWISIRGKDIDNPVLLFLAGGPGGSQLATERRALGKLEDDFVVVNWEQPGSGKSFGAVNISTMTPERYIDDGLALTAYLQERFAEDKIYVLGESWGSVLGIWLVQRQPDAFHAFIGTGQMVAFLDTDMLCYEFALNLLRVQGNSKKADQLVEQGPPPYYGKGVALKESAFLMETFSYMNADPNIADNGFNTFQDLASGEYGLYDKVNWVRGLLMTMDSVYPLLWEIDLREQAAHLDVPVFFLIGRHDVNAPPAITESYFEILDVPHKELVWFERSGHNPWVTESDLFVEMMVDDILPATYFMNQ